MTTRIIGTGDDPEAHYTRVQTMAKLIAGHAVEIVTDCDDLTIRLRVGEHVFECARDEYPSPQLVANVALAVDAAKYVPDAFAIGDLSDDDLTRFDPRHHRPLTEIEQHAKGVRW